jgi:hypothetical protein
MYAFGILSVGLLGLAQTVAAHGYLKSIEVSGKSYLAWQVGQDDYVTPEPSRYARRIKDNGPVPDFTTVNITCNQGGNIPSKGTVPVIAGDKVKLVWDQWGSSHSGPVMSESNAETVSIVFTNESLQTTSQTVEVHAQTSKATLAAPGSNLIRWPTILRSHRHGALTFWQSKVLLGPSQYQQISSPASTFYVTRFLDCTSPVPVWERNSIPRVYRSRSVAAERRACLQVLGSRVHTTQMMLVSWSNCGR